MLLARSYYEYLISMRNSRRPPAEIQALQGRKLKRLLAYSYDNVPFYHELMDRLGLKPSDFSSIADLPKLPVLTRDEITRNVQSMASKVAKNGEAISTTGTTGSPLTVTWSRAFCDRSLGLVMRRSKYQGNGFFTKVVWLTWFGSDANSSVRQSANFSRKLYKMLSGKTRGRYSSARAKTIGLSKDNLADVASFLSRFRPEVIHSRPSYLQRIKGIADSNVLDLKAKRLICEGEFLSDRIRKELQSSYDAEIFDCYGANEFRSLGFECKEHSGIHLNSDYFIFEFLRNGQPALPGERGEAVITGLDNEAMPLIRYKVGDIVVTRDEELCGCGSSLQKVDRIEGRLSDGLVSISGERIPPGLLINHIESVLSLRDYQVIQTAKNKIIVKVSKETSESSIASLGSYVRSQIGGDLEISIERQNAGEYPVKYRPVISEI